MPVRLACLNHAASVQAEPGSNSSIEFLGTDASSCVACEGDASVAPTGAPTDSFSIGVNPRNEFVHRFE